MQAMSEQQTTYQPPKRVLLKGEDGSLMAWDRLSGEKTLIPPLDFQEIERRKQVAERLREWQSSSPYYSEQAKAALKRGGAEAEVEYWQSLARSCVNLRWPKKMTASSTAEATAAQV